MLCWFLLYNNYWMCTHAQSFSRVWLLTTLWACNPPKRLCSWDSPGKNSGVGCHFLLHRIFLSMALNPRLLQLLNWQVGFLPLAPPGKSCIEVKVCWHASCPLAQELADLDPCDEASLSFKICPESNHFSPHHHHHHHHHAPHNPPARHNCKDLLTGLLAFILAPLKSVLYIKARMTIIL